jgi:hypothetical protein
VATFDGVNSQFLTSKNQLGADSGSKKALKRRFGPVFIYVLGLQANKYLREKL